MGRTDTDGSGGRIDRASAISVVAARGRGHAGRDALEEAADRRVDLVRHEHLVEVPGADRATDEPVGPQLAFATGSSPPTLIIGGRRQHMSK